jgi:hypothetical protein
VPVEIDNDPLSPTANSYNDVEEVTNFLNVRLNAEAWAAASPDDQKRACIMATQQIDMVCAWNLDMCGWRHFLDQPLEFPRIAVRYRDGDFFYPATIFPPWLKAGHADQALATLIADRTQDPPLRGLAAVSAEGVDIRFDVLADRGRGAPESQQMHVICDYTWIRFAPWVLNAPGANELHEVPIVR